MIARLQQAWVVGTALGLIAIATLSARSADWRAARSVSQIPVSPAD